MEEQKPRVRRESRQRTEEGEMARQSDMAGEGGEGLTEREAQRWARSAGSPEWWGQGGSPRLQRAPGEGEAQAGALRRPSPLGRPPVPWVHLCVCPGCTHCRVLRPDLQEPAPGVGCGCRVCHL